MNYLVDSVNMIEMNSHLVLFRSLDRGVSELLLKYNNNPRDIMTTPERCTMMFLKPSPGLIKTSIIKSSTCDNLMNEVKDIQLIYAVDNNPIDYKVCLYKLQIFYNMNRKGLMERVIMGYTMFSNEWRPMNKYILKFQSISKDPIFTGLLNSTEITFLYDYCSAFSINQLLKEQISLECWRNPILQNDISIDFNKCKVNSQRDDYNIVISHNPEGYSSTASELSHIDHHRLFHHPCKQLSYGEVCDIESKTSRFYMILPDQKPENSKVIFSDKIDMISDRDLRSPFTYVCKSKDEYFKHTGFMVEDDRPLDKSFKIKDLDECFKDGNCDGDVAFCNNFKCLKNHKTNSSLKCSIDYYYTTTFIKLNNDRKLFHKIVNVIGSYPISRKLKGLEVSDSCESCTFSCEQGTLMV